MAFMEEVTAPSIVVGKKTYESQVIGVCIANLSKPREKWKPKDEG